MFKIMGHEEMLPGFSKVTLEHQAISHGPALTSRVANVKNIYTVKPV